MNHEGVFMFLNKNVYSEDSVTGLFDVGDSGWTFLGSHQNCREIEIVER